jgi:hypothetical protein
MNPVQRRQGCKIFTMCLDLSDVREAIKLCNIVAFIDLENFPALRHHEHLLVSTFDVNHSFVLELRCQRELTHWWGSCLLLHLERTTDNDSLVGGVQESSCRVGTAESINLCRYGYLGELIEDNLAVRRVRVEAELTAAVETTGV